MEVDLHLQAPTSAIHKALQLYLEPKHQLVASFLKSIHHFSENSILDTLFENLNPLIVNNVEKPPISIAMWLTIISADCQQKSLPN